jgi:hypothetical protein
MTINSHDMAAEKHQLCELNAMEEHTFKNVNNCLNTNTYSYVGTYGGQSSNLSLNVVHVFNTSVN